MKKISLLIILSLFCLSVYSQLTKEIIDERVKRTFLETRIDDKSLYIINGIPVMPENVNDTLNKISDKRIIGVNYIDSRELNDKLSFDKQTIMIIVSTFGCQPKKIIKSEFEESKKYFKKRNIIINEIDTSLREPVLIINGKVIFHSECKKTIESINLKDIEGINIIRKPVSPEYYGKNSLNGLVEIWIKKK